MDALKKILAVMVGIFVVVLVGGGLYVYSMSGMNHSAGAKQDTQTQAGNNAQQDNKNKDQNSQDSKDQKDQQKNDSQKPPQVVQVLPPEPKKDPRQYVNDLEATLRSVEEANALIINGASPGMTVQQSPNSTNTVIGTDKDTMTSTHKGLYQMGQSVADMKQVVRGMNEEVQQARLYDQNFFATPPAPYQYPPYYGYGYPPYGAPGYNPYNPYYPNGQNPNGQNPNGQNNTNGQAGSNQQNPQQPDQTTAHNTSTGSLLNGQTLNLAFNFILIISLVLGIIAIVGFVGSLLKKDQQQTANPS